MTAPAYLDQCAECGNRVVSWDLDRASAACGLSKRELQVAISDGDLVAHYRGRKPLIRPEDLDDFITSLPTERAAS